MFKNLLLHKSGKFEIVVNGKIFLITAHLGVHSQNQLSHLENEIDKFSH